MVIKNFIKVIVIFLFVSYFLILNSNFVSAVDYLPLVPCGLNQQPSGGDPNNDYTRACTRCDSFRLVKNVIDFVLIGIVPVAAAVLFIAGGLVIVLAGARPEWISTGRQIFWNTFIGLVVIFSSWLVVNTFLKSFAPDQAAAPWYRFTCEPETGRIRPGGPPAPGAACSDPQGLARSFNAPLPNNFPQTPGVNAPELDALIFCVNSRLGNVIDQNQLYTYERDNPLCNLTRGSRICGICTHRVNSCHYGGSDGTSGSLAVDFKIGRASCRERV